MPERASARAQQVELTAAMHLAADQLQPGDVPFGRPVGPRPGERRAAPGPRSEGAAPKVPRCIERALPAPQATPTELDREIDHQIRGFPAWRAAENPLTSVSGVGPVTARTLVAE